ncbi:MAG TPA: galactose-1-phosphate uridylyltransferase [Thermoanaerobacterium sp.]|nr:galactose-1-phosphate uridylyltransferase [Thermoanaerobacterium sp.]
MSEIRYDIVTGKIAVISTERGKRPHDFKKADVIKSSGVCPFCPGNETMTPPTLVEFRGEDGMWTLRGFNNKFAAFKKDVNVAKHEGELYQADDGYGVAEIIVESQHHDMTLGQMEVEGIENIMKALILRYDDIAKDEKIKYVQMFKNFGANGGASLEHGHWQIMGVSFVPEILERELKGVERHKADTGRCPYCHIIDEEMREKARIVAENDKFIVICPYASQFAYESWILPKKHVKAFNEMDDDDIRSLSSLLKSLIKKYEDLFDNPPYNIVIHTVPHHDRRDFHWHVEILPRLTTFAGFELATGAYINPTPPEEAASILRLD